MECNSIKLVVLVRKYWELVLTVFFKLSGTAIGALSALLLAWGSGEEGVGVFAILRTLPLLLGMLTDCGVSHSYAFLVNRKGFEVRDVVVSLLAAATFSAAIQIAIVLLLGWDVAKIFELDLSGNAIALSSILAPVMMFQVHAVNLLRAKDKLRIANIFLVSCEVIMLLGILFSYLVFGLSADLIAYSICASSLFVFIGACLLIKREYGGGRGFLRKDILVKGAVFGAKSQLGNLMQVMSYRFDQLIVSALLGVSALGVYVVASKVAELFKVLSVALVFVLEPSISRMSADAARQYVWESVRLVYLGNLIIVIVGFFAGPLLIEVAFDEWASQSIIPFYLLLSGLAVSGGNGLFAAHNLGVGRPELNTYATLVGMLASVILNICLVPIFGIDGAALASAIAYMFATAWYVGQFRLLGRGRVESDGAGVR